MSRDCTICGEPIILVPSAKARADKCGETPAFYTALFTEHGECTVAKRSAESVDTMRRHRETGIGAIL